MYNLVHFVYENDLQNVKFRRMNRDLSQLNISIGGVDVKDLDYRLYDGKKIIDVVPNEAMILVPILEEMKDLKAFNSKLRTDFYKVFLSVDNYENDDKLIAAIKEANKNFIDINLDKIKEITKNTGQPDVLKRIVAKRLEDVRAVKQDAQPEITDKFKKADVKVTPENLMIEYIGYPDESKVIGDNDLDNIQKLIDDSIVFILNYAVKKLAEIEKNIYDYNNLLKERIRIDSGNNSAIMLSLKEIIERWQAFVQTPLFGQEIMDGMMKQIQKNDNGRFDNIYNFEFKILKPGIVQNVVKVIENLKLNNKDRKEVSDGLKEITGDKKLSADRELAVKVEILKFLTAFFQTSFDIKKTLQMTKTVGSDTYYDAACVLVYIKDNKIKESYEVGDVMLFEGSVLFENHDWTTYFKKLSQMVMDFIAKRRETDKKADIFSYLRSEENKFETSREDENKISIEIADDIEKLKEKSEEQFHQMKDDVEHVIKSQEETILSGKDNNPDKNVKSSNSNNEVPQTTTPGKPGAQQ